MMGTQAPIEIKLKATLAVNLPSNHGREEYVSVRLLREGNNYRAEPVYGKSGMISVLADADGFIRIDRDCEGIAAGTAVDVLML
jgi:molybdopterin molybdotransferase